MLASLLAIGAVARLRYAQTLYVLPVSLFGMSIAAAELPELARERAGATGALRDRVSPRVRRVAFFVVPSFVAFVVLGDVLVAGIYPRRRVRRGRRHARVAHARGLQRRTDRIDEHARLSIRVLRVARHARRRRASRDCVC